MSVFRFSEGALSFSLNNKNQSMAPALSPLARYSSPGVCDTLQCQEISAILKTFVDLNVDPCSDFFQYTCKTR